MTNPVWDGVTIDFEALKNYGWYNTTVTTGDGQTYPRLVGYQVAGLRDMAAALSAGQTASAEAVTAAAQAVPAATTATNASATAVAAANTAAGIVQHVQPSEIAGIPPILDFPFSGAAAVPAGVITGSSGKWVTNQAGVLVNVASGTAPIDFDPTTSALRGLLVEESRTNLIVYSQQFDNAAWTKTGVTVTADASVSPAGDNTADLVVESATTGVHEIAQTGRAISAGATVTISAYIKEGSGGRWPMLAVIGASGTGYVHYQPSTNTLGTARVSGAYTSPSATVTSVGRGIYRLCLTCVTATDTSVTPTVRIKQSNDGVTSYTGDGASGVYLWGAQFEVASFATSYMPTVGSTVTRAAGVNTLLLSSIPGWNPNEGTIYVEAMALAANSGAVIAGFDGGSFSDTMYIAHSGTSQIGATVNVGGVSQANISAAATQTNMNRIAFGWKANDFGFSVNGSAAVTDSSGSLPSVTSLHLGKAPWTAGNFLNGHIRRITLFPRRLSNATLQLLTA